MHGNSTRENREAPSTPVAEGAAGRLEKALSPKSSMHVDGESDGRVVPAKCPNKGEQAPTEGMEGRRPTKENIGQATPPRTQSRTSELSDLHGVREVARRVNLIPTCASTPGIRGRSRMQQFCTYGSVRGAPGNRRPYRDKKGFREQSNVWRFRSLLGGKIPQLSLGALGAPPSFFETSVPGNFCSGACALQTCLNGRSVPA